MSPSVNTTGEELLPTAQEWAAEIVRRLGSGDRFAGLFGADRGDGVQVNVLLANRRDIDTVSLLVQPNERNELHYPSLSLDVPAAFWYERALHDLSGVVPDGHPRLDPLLLPIPAGQEHPRPGRPDAATSVSAEDRTAQAEVRGQIFALPYGPVRSGITESIELLLETPGEDIPHLNIRPHYKHRGIAKRFEGLNVDRGVLVAERVEGISTVAHALGFCHAVERLSDCVVPARAGLIRVVYAELERIANHLDVTMRLADAAGLAVATARFGWHKENVLRLVSRMCGNRFARSVVLPGGVRAMPALPPDAIAVSVADLYSRLRGDIAALESSSSFLDRLRTTGPLPADLARSHGALGPIGRASGFDDDDRRARTYDGYSMLAEVQAPKHADNDALSRARVRWHEISTSVGLVLAALDAIVMTPEQLHADAHAEDGYALGWAEAAQGEALYALEMRDGHISRCLARSASLHNMVLFHDVFAGDIFTDLPFIEASFGLSYAGVSM